MAALRQRRGRVGDKAFPGFSGDCLQGHSRGSVSGGRRLGRISNPVQVFSFQESIRESNCNAVKGLMVLDVLVVILYGTGALAKDRVPNSCR